MRAQRTPAGELASRQYWEFKGPQWLHSFSDFCFTWLELIYPLIIVIWQMRWLNDFRPDFRVDGDWLQWQQLTGWLSVRIIWHILIMPSACLRSDTYKSLSHWFVSTRIRTREVWITRSPNTGDGCSTHLFGHLVMSIGRGVLKWRWPVILEVSYIMNYFKLTIKTAIYIASVHNKNCAP